VNRDALPPQQARGLDLTDLDHVTPEEITAFAEHYKRLHGRPHAGFDFFLSAASASEFYQAYIKPLRKEP